MALLVKLRPSGAWRAGPDSGDRLRVGRVLHSDALYSALTRAFLELGELDAWLEATALHAGGAQIRSSSCFPFVGTESGDTLLLPPPESLWPPPDSLRIRWKSARYVPPTAIWQLLSGKPLIEEHWVVDGVSECLLPVIRNLPAPSPFRVAIRSHAAVDRLGQGVEPHQTACLEFSRGSGIWIAFSFADQSTESRWAPALKGALKLIADSGLGGERSNGWGRFETPEFIDGEIGPLLFGNRYRAPEDVAGHWLLSLFSPAADDAVDWQQGNYRMVVRTGRVESSAGWGAPKRANQMIAEGGVLVSPTPPKGVARDVAPIGFAHPVYRAGFALTIPIGKPKPPQAPSKSAPPSVVVDDTLLESLSSPKASEAPASDTPASSSLLGSGPIEPQESEPLASAPETPHAEPTVPEAETEPRPSGSGPDTTSDAEHAAEVQTSSSAPEPDPIPAGDPPSTEKEEEPPPTPDKPAPPHEDPPPTDAPPIKEPTE